MEIIQVAITDDDALIVGLLHDYLQTRSDINVVITAQSGHELFKKLETAAVKPQVLLLDLKMEGMDGIEVTQKLKAQYSEIKVIVVSSHYQKMFTGFMLKTGVSAFLPKGVMPSELVNVIQAVNKFGFYFKEDQLDIIRGQISGKSPKPSLNEESDLSEREIEVLKLICQQKTAKEIGEELFITQRTAEGHKNSLFAKTGAKNIAGLVIYAIQNGILRVDELPVIN